MRTTLSVSALMLLMLACCACAAPSALPEASRTATPSPVATPSPSPATPTQPAPTAQPPASPTIEATPTSLACWKAGGRYETGSLESALLPQPLEYRIYLPPCYDELPDRRYPLLYLIHGQSYNHDQWDRLGVDEAAEALIASGEIAPLMIVLPRYRSWLQPPDNRFGQALVQELLPHVDKQYRSIPDRAHRAIGGLSMGAAWAVHLGISEWRLFGAIGAHSLPVFWNDTKHLRAWLREIPPDQLPRIYLDIGELDRKEILASARWFEQMLTEENIPHEWHLFPGSHNEAYWASHVEQYLRWYARDW